MIGLSKFKTYINQIRADLTQLIASRAEDGPYRYLIRNWESISDLNLASQVLGLDVFRQQLEPVILPVEKFKSYLVIAPHQDDESIGAGGTLVLANRANAKITIVFVTDGGQKINGCVNYNKDIRNREAAEVCRKLNADYYDLNISNISPQPKFDDVVKLSEIIEKVKPQVVLCPWVLDSPLKHRMANHLFYLAGKYKKLDDFEVWGYQTHNSLPLNGVVDITEVADEKRSLIECYKSQNENFYRYDHITMGISAWNSKYLGRRKEESYAEIFFTQPKNEYLKLVETFYFRNLGETYLQNDDLMKSLENLHKEINEKSKT